MNVSMQTLEQQTPLQFMNCGSLPLGIYPLVNRAAKMPELIAAGVSTIQLRVKDLHGDELEQEIAQAVNICSLTHCRLFINDYWQLAIQYRAYGVHLGQEDLADADLEAIHNAGLRLGISTHQLDEIFMAHRDCIPSYIAIGPIFGTTSKSLDYDKVGVQQLQKWNEQVTLPVVAIGGIHAENLADVVHAGADGIAMIQGVHQAGLSLKQSALQLVQAFQSARQLR